MDPQCLSCCHCSLLCQALSGRVRDKVELAMKFGISFEDNKREVRGDPAYVRSACEGSLKRLGVNCADLYYQHRIDTRLPIEVTVKNPTAHIEHEARTSKIGEDQQFYFQQRGIDYEKAMAAMISRFFQAVFNELPDEFGS